MFEIKLSLLNCKFCFSILVGLKKLKYLPIIIQKVIKLNKRIGFLDFIDLIRTTPYHY